jgi:ATP-dependent Lon protease
VLIPEENEKDLVDIPKNIKAKLDIRPVRWIDEVLSVALTHMPEALGSEPTPKVPEVAKGGSEPRRRNVRHH